MSAISEGLGRGATFIIELPLDVASGCLPGVEDGAAAASPVEQRRVNLSGIRVLVVDDEPDALEMTRRILEDGGARVRTASSADSALDILLTDTFDVILSDIAMPDFDGYDFIAELRRRGVGTPAIALTAFALSDDQRKATSMGYQTHLAKPIETPLLLAAVARLVNAKD